MTVRVPVRPEILRWARERAQLDFDELAQKIPNLPAWERGEKQPTMKQLEHFAKKTHTPMGYLFLSKPPEEKFPIPDFRAIADKPPARPSINLLNTVYLCQQRQRWYIDHARTMGENALEFVGTARTTNDVVEVAANIRKTLGFEVAEQQSLPSWSDALRRFIERAEAVGMLVMVNGVVGNDTRRKLNPEEFRGFALVDELAPLIFINGADTKAAQMFTLAHELAHVWLGESALSNSEARSVHDRKSGQAIERWCNRVAAELLVPFAIISSEYDPDASLEGEMSRLARRYKVSTLVILRRMFDAGAISREEYWRAYDAELDRLKKLKAGSRRAGGGNFYSTLKVRVSERFATAIMTSALEGQASFTETFYLLGVKKAETFERFGSELGLQI